MSLLNDWTYHRSYHWPSIRRERMSAIMRRNMLNAANPRQSRGSHREQSELGSRIAKAISAYDGGEFLEAINALNSIFDVCGKLVDIARDTFGLERCKGNDEFFPRKDMAEIDGDFYCQSWIEDNAITCERCDCLAIIKNTQTVRVENGRGRIVEQCHCDDCANRHSFTCDSCDELYDDDLATNVDGDSVCRQCIENGDYFYWESDGEYHNDPEPEEDEDEHEPTNPDQGASERKTEVWKALSLQASAGISQVALPNNGIDEAGITEIIDFLLPYGEQDESETTARRRQLIDDFFAAEKLARNVELTEWVTKDGTLPKRLSKYFHKNESRKLSPSELSRIGDISRKYCPKQTEYRFDVTQSFDWRAGQFGDHGSCYWSCRTNARLQLQSQHNAFAIRFYDSENNGIGRAWIVVQNGIAFIFNAYGPHSLTTIARMLCEVMKGASYREIPELRNDGSSTEDLWINGGKGFAIGFAHCDDLPTSHDFQLSL